MISTANAGSGIFKIGLRVLGCLQMVVLACATGLLFRAGSIGLRNQWTRCTASRIVLRLSDSRMRSVCSSSMTCPISQPALVDIKQKNLLEVQASVNLREEEQRIFTTLLQAERHFNLGTQLRVAGGWVRDKLLRKDCYDIDIALDNMLGREFCEKVNDYLKSIGEETHNVGVIMSNPDQSKHLETARMRIHGVWVDFVNLRAETYAEDSRIPTMEFGTPKQDAERRDLTINSLFYNINTGLVEDYTERGIQDLKSGIIATPLEPKITFLDDPLRVLRAIRFGARFGFDLNKDLMKAAASEEVRAALSKKISRERIGHEIELMLLGNDPTRAMQLLLDLKLFEIVFCPPPNLQCPLSEVWERMCLERIRAASEVLHHFGSSKLSTEQKRVFLLSALLFPLKDSTYQDRKRKVFPTTSFIIRESLKLKNSDSDGVTALQNTAEEFADVIKALLSPDGRNENGKRDFHNETPVDTWEGAQRLKAGLLLRKVKELWRAALALSSLAEYDGNTTWNAQERTKICITVEETITRLGLESVWDMKPLLDGKEIMEELKLSGGPIVKKWKDLAIQWQLAHPNGTATECCNWLKLQHEQ